MEDSSDVNITVRTINNDSYTLTIPTSTSVLELKERLSSMSSVPIDRQRLIYRGRVLEDGSKLDSYSISSGHVIHLVARPANYQQLRDDAMMRSDDTRQGMLSFASASASGAPRMSPTRTSAPGIDSGAGTTSTMVSTNAHQSATSTTTSTETTNASGANSLEHVRQSLLTFHTLMSTMGMAGESLESWTRESFLRARGLLPAHTTSSEDQKEGCHLEGTVDSMGGADDRERKWFIGQWLDVKDTVQQWLEATIMDVNHAEKKLYIHYNGWPSRWDEWIAWDSPRVAPFRTRTAHNVAYAAHASPTPTTPVPHAPLTGIDDVRSVLPELARIVQVLQPLTTVAARLSMDSMQYDNEALFANSAEEPKQGGDGRHAGAEEPHNNAEHASAVLGSPDEGVAGGGSVRRPPSTSAQSTQSSTLHIPDGLPWHRETALASSILNRDIPHPSKVFPPGQSSVHEQLHEGRLATALDEVLTNLCPLLDRIGRTFIDIAPRLTAHVNASHERLAAIGNADNENNRDFNSSSSVVSIESAEEMPDSPSSMNAHSYDLYDFQARPPSASSTMRFDEVLGDDGFGIQRSQRVPLEIIPEARSSTSILTPIEPLIGSPDTRRNDQSTSATAANSVSSVAQTADVDRNGPNDLADSLMDFSFDSFRRQRPVSPSPEAAFRAPVTVISRGSNYGGLGEVASTGSDGNAPGYLDIHIAILTQPQRPSVESILSQAVSSLQAQSQTLATQQATLENLRTEQQQLRQEQQRVRQRHEALRRRRDLIPTSVTRYSARGNDDNNRNSRGEMGQVIDMIHDALDAGPQEERNDANQIETIGSILSSFQSSFDTEAGPDSDGPGYSAGEYEEAGMTGTAANTSGANRSDEIVPEHHRCGRSLGHLAARLDENSSYDVIPAHSSHMPYPYADPSVHTRDTRPTVVAPSANICSRENVCSEQDVHEKENPEKSMDVKLGGEERYADSDDDVSLDDTTMTSVYDKSTFEGIKELNDMPGGSAVLLRQQLKPDHEFERVLEKHTSDGGGDSTDEGDFDARNHSVENTCQRSSHERTVYTKKTFERHLRMTKQSDEESRNVGGSRPIGMPCAKSDSLATGFPGVRCTKGGRDEAYAAHDEGVYISSKRYSSSVSSPCSNSKNCAPRLRNAASARIDADITDTIDRSPSFLRGLPGNSTHDDDIRLHAPRCIDKPSNRQSEDNMNPSNRLGNESYAPSRGFVRRTAGGARSPRSAGSQRFGAASMYGSTGKTPDCQSSPQSIRGATKPIIAVAGSDLKPEVKSSGPGLASPKATMGSMRSASSVGVLGRERREHAMPKPVANRPEDCLSSTTPPKLWDRTTSPMKCWDRAVIYENQTTFDAIDAMGCSCEQKAPDSVGASGTRVHTCKRPGVSPPTGSAPTPTAATYDAHADVYLTESMQQNISENVTYESGRRIELEMPEASLRRQTPSMLMNEIGMRSPLESSLLLSPTSSRRSLRGSETISSAGSSQSLTHLTHYTNNASRQTRSTRDSRDRSTSLIQRLRSYVRFGSNKE